MHYRTSSAHLFVQILILGLIFMNENEMIRAGSHPVNVRHEPYSSKSCERKNMPPVIYLTVSLTEMHARFA